MKALLQARWQTLSARFSALTQREKWMVIAGVLGGLPYAGFTLFLEPALVQSRQAERSLADQRMQLSTMRSQNQIFQAEAGNPERAAKAQLEALRAERAELDTRFVALESALVPPQRMTGLLNELLTGSGLQVLSLRTLPLAPVLAKEPAKAEAGQKPAVKESSDTSATAEAPTGASADMVGGLYKHGVEVRLEGSYQALADYLARLESSSVKLLWHSLSLSTDKHPRLVLTLTLYTLSMDPTWLSF